MRYIPNGTSPNTRPSAPRLSTLNHHPTSILWMPRTSGPRSVTPSLPARSPHHLAIAAPVAQDSFSANSSPPLPLPQSNQHTTRPLPSAASEPDNCRTKPESHKHPRERSITDRSGQQYPGEIAAGGPATPGGTARRKDLGRVGQDA